MRQEHQAEFFYHVDEETRQLLEEEYYRHIGED